MGQFVDEKDVRRPLEFPRISERYRTKIETVWFPPRRGATFGRSKGVGVQVLDLSIAGALLLAPTHSGLRPGVKLKLILEDVTGVVAIRHVRVSSTPSHSYYGVVFFSMTGELETKVLGLVAEATSTA